MHFLKLCCLLLAVCLLGGCGSPNTDTNEVQIANPWQNFETLEQAEKAAGFSLGIPEEIGNCRAAVFRVMNGTLLEVVYQSENEKITVRKALGDEDISGDYNTYETAVIAEYANGSAALFENKKITARCGEYSWSVCSTEGFADETGELFVAAIFQQ